jgi:triosephosphate isomerase (TIM)
MMRKKIVAGNWKMNLDFAKAMALADAVADGLSETPSCEVLLAPPFVYLHDVLERIGHRSFISVAAQNCASQESGAFTGEVAASMLSSIGVEFVLIGHSERRQLFHETDEQLANKVKQAIVNGLIPVFCCGETLSEREAGKHHDVVSRQLIQGLFHLNPESFSDCVIAYEPVWAIGTGKTATVEQAQEMHAYIRSLITGHYSPATAGKVPLLYGGSVTAANAASLFAAPDVDGALVGGASLKSADFLSIIKSCSGSRNA